jgi:hypothetical protein
MHRDLSDDARANTKQRDCIVCSVVVPSVTDLLAAVLDHVYMHKGTQMSLLS